jgi:hypothetical protein
LAPLRENPARLFGHNQNDSDEEKIENRKSFKVFFWPKKNPAIKNQKIQNTQKVSEKW